MTTIMHIAKRTAWDAAVREGSYRGDTLDSQGFIHCSMPAQVAGVANAIYRGALDLILLCIDTTAVQAEIRYEGSDGGEQFPHIYGPLNTGAVTRVLIFEPDADGLFASPPGV